MDITLPSGGNAKLKDFVSHKMARTLNNIIIGEQNLMKMRGGVELEEFELTGESAQAYNDALVMGLILELNGSTAVSQNDLDNLSQKDFDALLGASKQIYDQDQGKTDPKA